MMVKQTLFIIFISALLLPAASFARGMPSAYQNFYKTDFSSGFDSCIVRQESAKGSLATVAARGLPDGAAKVLKVSLRKDDGARAGVSLNRCSKFLPGRDYMVTWSTYMPPEY